jgi:hypothetical protein
LHQEVHTYKDNKMGKLSTIKEMLKKANSPAGRRANTEKLALVKRLDEEDARKAIGSPKKTKPKLSAKESKEYLSTQEKIRELKEKIGKKGGGKYLSNEPMPNTRMKTDSYMKGNVGLKRNPKDRFDPDGYREGGKVKKANENPNKKLEEQGNTTKSNMGEGRIKIDALDKLMKRGKYAPVKKAAGGMLKSAPNKGVTKLPKDVRNKMGFMKKGGTVKTHTMPDGTKMKGAKHGMKHGGAVKGKKCRMDGIAVRGKTRAKQRSK